MKLEDAITEARALHETRQSVGFNQDALELAAREGFQNGAFEETEDEIPDVLEEFFPEEGAEGGGTVSKAKSTGKQSLQQKLDSKTI